MPAIAHIGIGFAAKKVVPSVSVIILIVAAELIEIIFMILWGFGIEHPLSEPGAPFSPYSHSILFGVLWSVLAGLLTHVISKKTRISWIIGLLVFSHTILDLIASPKLAFYPNDTGLPLLFDYTYTYGLGLWKNKIVAGIGEIGILVAGIIIFIMTIRKKRAESLKIKGTSKN
ncbi:MAG: hypothetical protein EOM90_13830 [Alphaproteobacteria bacterium]|nr:hypothetical protein [Alphaproteobacteria bacterium]